ncbi:MAG TPA: efflux RND transporter permease subunit, partial [bacterium]|nr:efflux RND transporter permease subunit [bacterium]
AFYTRFLKWCLGYPVDRLMAEARSGKLPWFKSLVSKIFFTNPKALVADAQEEIKNPRYSLAPIAWFIAGLGLVALAKAWKLLAFEIAGPLVLLVFLVYLWEHRHFLFAHLLYDHRWGVVFGAMVIFAGSLFLALIIKKEMVPSTDQSVFMINLQLPVDYSIFRTDGVVKQCEAALKPRGEIQNLYVAVGGFGSTSSNTALIFTTMKPPGQRPVADRSEKFTASGPLGFISRVWDRFQKPRLTQAEFMEVCRKALKKVSPDLQVFLVDLSKRGLSTGKGYDVEFIVTGPDWDKLAGYSAEIEKQMKASPLLADVNNNYLSGLPEIQIVPDRAKAALRGINIQDLGTVLATLVGGYTFQSTYYHEGGHDNDIFIRMPQGQRLKPDVLKKVYTRNNRGELVAVSDVTTMTETPALQQITRDNRLRAIYFLANASPKATGQQALDETLKIAKAILPAGYNAGLTGTSQAGSQTDTQLILTMGLGIIVAYMVLTTQFNSFLQPWVVLLALPFSITGAFAALWLFNQSLNMYSLIGLILLLGLVKKNSIMIVAFTNQAREKGMGLTDALLYACPMRLRPILMTSFATVAGALPAAMALGPGAELRQPMSVAVIGGILFSTLLTLVVVPCAYSIMSGWERPEPYKFKVGPEGNLVTDSKKTIGKRAGAGLVKRHA